jgi:hypothetical protein
VGIERRETELRTVAEECSWGPKVGGIGELRH